MKSAKPLYERRSMDYSYRTDNGGRTTLQCRAHMHYHLELAYIISGSVRAFIDSDEYLLGPGDICLVFPNRVHRFTSEAKKMPDGTLSGCEKYMLFIVNPDIMPELSKQFSGMPPETPVIHPETPELFETLSLLAGFSVSDNAQKSGVLPSSAPFSGLSPSSIETIRRGYLLAFFSNLLGRMKFTLPKPSNSSAMQAIVDFCSKNFTAELSLGMLENELHISKYYISHLFSTRMNMRFNDYINSLRISEACRYLRSSDKSITEISELVGFGTQRTFNRAFSKQMGITPCEYRKMSGNYITVSMPV